MNFLGLKEFDIIRSESNDNGDVVYYSRRLLFVFPLSILLYFPDEFQAFQYESERAYRDRKF